MANEFKSYKHKIVDFGLVKGSMKDPVTSETINYTQLVIKIMTEDGLETVVLSGKSAPKPALLRTVLNGADAQDSKRTLLDDEDDKSNE